MRQPRLLLLDEPTSGVDIKTRHDILHLLRDLNADGMTILLTTHDLNSVAAHLPQVICLRGTVLAQGHPDEVFPTLSRVYGAEMVVLRQGNLILVADRRRLGARAQPFRPGGLSFGGSRTPGCGWGVR